MKIKHFKDSSRYVNLSIDVGIKNLAMCIMECDTSSKKPKESSYSILLWDTFNILDSHPICSGILKNKKICSKKASFQNNLSENFCKTHIPKNIKTTPLKIKNVNDYLLQDIVLKVLIKLNYIFTENIEIFKKIDKINIELQPKINPKMKMISHLIFGKCIDFLHPFNPNIQIRFVSASKKLKKYKGPPIECNLKTKYARTKKLSIEYGVWSLEHLFCEDEKSKWIPFIEKFKTKQDDLFDTFNMCMNEFSNCSF